MDRKSRVFGIPELDSELFPCLPAGWLALVTGGPGSAMHLLAKQFANAGVGALPVLYYTTGERTVDAQKAFRDRGWDPEGVRIVNLLEEYYNRALARNLEVSRTRELGLSFRDVVGGPTNIAQPLNFDLRSRVLGDLAQIDSPFRLVLDSIDFLLEVLSTADVLNVARHITARAQGVGGQAMLLLQSDAHDRRIVGLLEDMAEVVIDLAVEPDGNGFRHMLSVRKVRNYPERTRIYTASLTEHGLDVAGPNGSAATSDST